MLMQSESVGAWTYMVSVTGWGDGSHDSGGNELSRNENRLKNPGQASSAWRGWRKAKELALCLYKT